MFKQKIQTLKISFWSHLLFTLVLLFSVFISCDYADRCSGSVLVRVNVPDCCPDKSPPLELNLIDQDPNVLFSKVRLNRRYKNQNELLEEFRQSIESCRITSCQGFITVDLNYTNIKPGHYWVITSQPLEAGDERIMWSHPLSITPENKECKIVLQRSNAAMVIDPENFIF